MQVRPAGPGDAEACVSVLSAVAEEREWIATEPPVDVPERVERMRAGIVDESDRLWVLETDGRVVGTLGLHPTPARGVASLGMCILQEARGRGGGRALVDAALDHARERHDLHKVQLEVYVENGPAIALYASAGFSVEGFRRDHYLRQDGRRRSTLIMALLVG
jgi:RimJ/RimL family protein N-acetyltransferase